MRFFRPRATLRQTLHNDGGVSLVELIIVVVVMGIIGSLITMIFVNGLTSQQATAARDLATGRATVITETLADSVRNAVAIRVSSDGSRIDATVAVSDTSFACRAWAIQPDGDFVYSGGSTARSASTASWGVLAEKVSGALTGGAGTPRAFALSGSRVLDVGLYFAPALALSSSPEKVAIRTTVTSQARHQGAVPSCF